MATFDELDKTFNITPIEDSEVTSVEIVSAESTIEPTKEEEILKDYEHSREQLYNLIEKGQDAIKGIMDVAAQTDHPRAYEVAFQGIKNVSELADKLMDVHKKMKDIEEDSKVQRGPSTVNNSVFFGSTAELQKFIKQSKINNKEE
jgi:hypothetical protein